MNKLWKKGTTWRRLPRRVSPLLNVIQAFAAVGVVVLFLLLFQYRESASPLPMHRIRKTAYISEKDHPLAKLAAELDPAGFLHNNPGQLAVPRHIYEVSQAKLDLPRPGRMYVLPGVEGFKKLALNAPEAAADPTLVPRGMFLPVQIPEAMNIMYDAFGREVVRWQSDIDAVEPNSLFRIEGKDFMQCIQMVSSSGNARVDQQIMRKAVELHLPSGLYSVLHPVNKAKGN
ncbi:MAG: hypothetical protein IKZ33_04370 [Lentisphaeria bacterium]|nr:hypothetical protein [Lentisphaeria bacterium]